MSTVTVRFEGENRGAVRAADGTRRAIDNVGQGAKRNHSFLAGFGKTALIGVAALGALGVAGGALGGKMVSLASDAAEVESKFKIIFGKEMPGMIDNLDAFSRATGASKFELREQVADMGALLEPLTANKKEAGELSIQFTKLATDLGSFNNVPTADALLAIRSGLVGEAEPLRRFGVLLNEGAVAAEAYRSGIAKQGAELTEQQKVQARANLIMQQTTLAQGDAERTAGSFANQVKALKNGFTDMGTELGVILMPHLLTLITWINANMPTIKRVVEGAITGIVAAINFLIPIISKLIDWFRQLADFTRRHWDEVQAAAARVVAWYRGTLAPAIQTILTFIQALWERFGGAITKIVSTSLGVLIAIVRTTLGNLASVINAVMAILRGDWSKAWSELGEIPGRTLHGIVAVVKGFASIMFTAAAAIGKAIIEGIVSGFTGLLGHLKDTLVNGVKGAIGGLGGALGIGSPSRLMADLIGKPMAEGVIAGWVDGSRALPEKMKDTVRSAVDAAAAVVAERRSAFASAFDSLTSEALAAFDELSSQIETRTEKKLRVMDEKAAAAERKLAIAEGRAGVGTASEALTQGEGESLEDFTRRQAEREAAIIAAQRVLDEALAAQQRFKLEQDAARERVALNERLALKRRHFEEDLLALQNYATRHTLTQQQLQTRTLALMAKYGIDLKDSTLNLGAALEEGLRESLAGVSKAAKALAQEIITQLSRIRVIVNVDISTKGDPQKRQHGGPVRAGQPYLVGEDGMELFVPSLSGKIVPNSMLRSPGAGGSSGGSSGGNWNVNVTINGGGYFVGSRVQLAEELATLIKPQLPRVAMYESRV